MLSALCALALPIRPAQAKQPKPQALWVASDTFISVFQGTALESGGSPEANLAFSIKDYLDPIAIAFDQHDNLWITDLSDLGADSSIMDVPRADIVSLKAGAMAKRRLVDPVGPSIKSGGWFGLGFDAAGNLFVSNGQQLPKVPHTRLEKTHPSPSIDVSLLGSTFIPKALRFDDSNNLWLADPGLSQVLKFARRDRAASGPPEPDLTLNLLSDFFQVTDLSFDHSGNLWLAGLALHGTGPFIDEVEMISAADLTGTGWVSVSPSVTVTSVAFGSGSCLGGLDFDHSGNLWVSVVGTTEYCAADTQLVEFTPDQLSTGGSLTPSVIIGQNSGKTNISFPGPIRFGPIVR